MLVQRGAVKHEQCASANNSALDKGTSIFWDASGSLVGPQAANKTDPNTDVSEHLMAPGSQRHAAQAGEPIKRWRDLAPNNYTWSIAKAKHNKQATDAKRGCPPLPPK